MTAVAAPPASDLARDALDALARALVPRVAELLGARHDAGELVDVLRSVPAPRRALMRACRSGAIAGAARVGRRWVAARASVDEWLRTLGPRIVPPSAPDDGDDLDELRDRLARPAPRRRRGRAA